MVASDDIEIMIRGAKLSNSSVEGQAFCRSSIQKRKSKTPKVFGATDIRQVRSNYLVVTSFFHFRLSINFC